jgi:hypothetical protein
VQINDKNQTVMHNTAIYLLENVQFFIKKVMIETMCPVVMDEWPDNKKAPSIAQRGSA